MLLTRGLKSAGCVLNVYEKESENAKRFKHDFLLTLSTHVQLIHVHVAIGSKIRVCNAKGLACLAQYDTLIFKLQGRVGNNSHNCGCFLNCEDLNFKKDKSSITPW